MSADIRPFRWEGTQLELLDQRRLPSEEVWIPCRSPEEVAEAIRNMTVRGAPAIGIAAAFGLVLAARRQPTDLEEAAALLRSTRPTAVNLSWALDRLLELARRGGGYPELEAEAVRIAREDEEQNRRMGEYGQSLVPQGATVLTHCNAGALATGGYGTALGVIRAAWEHAKQVRVLADETRPLLQGARLTAWELARLGIPVTVIPDSAAGRFMRAGQVDLVVVGADRIAANGDVANKIGTYSVAVLAREHGIPFYVAAPLSTVDLATPSGEAIVVEERDPGEVTSVAGTATAPPGVPAANFAFDVTPHRLVTGIITEAGVIRPPYERNLRLAFTA